MTAAVSQVTIAPMVPEHAVDVLNIYRAGIDEGDATFETTAPTWKQFDAAKLAEHRYVALGTDYVVNGDRADNADHADTGNAGNAGNADSANNADYRVLGWIAVTAVSDRCIYAGVVEHSVYVHPEARGRGIGAALLHALIASTEAAGIWTIQSGIFPENTPSLALHRRCGFRVVGTRERIGRHHGVWRDVVLIERRSELT